MNPEVQKNIQLTKYFWQVWQGQTSLWCVLFSKIILKNVKAKIEISDLKVIDHIFSQFPEVNSIDLYTFDSWNGDITVNDYSFHCQDKFGYESWDFGPGPYNYPKFDTPEDKSFLVESNLSETRLKELCDLLHTLGKYFHSRTQNKLVRINP